MTGTYAFPRNVFLGFDHIFNELDNISKAANDSYPPHNVVKEDELEYVLELAVAGFGEGDISIELKDHILTIEGSREKRRDQEKYIHKGISARSPCRRDPIGKRPIPSRRATAARPWQDGRCTIPARDARGRYGHSSGWHRCFAGRGEP